MNSRTPGRAAIVGVGTTPFAASIADQTELELQIRAAKAAVDDAGLRMQDIDGIVVTDEGASNRRYHMQLGEMLGLFETPLCVSARLGGASPGYAVDLARMALEQGRCTNVLVVSGFELGLDGWLVRRSAMLDATTPLTIHYPDYEHPFGPSLAAMHALVAQRHMHDFGTTAAQLASVVVSARDHAARNETALFRERVTVDDVLDSPPVASPLHDLHCAPISDGAIAMVLTTEDRAGDLRHRPVFVEGHAAAHGGYYIGYLAGGGASGYDLVRTTARRAAADAFAQAGIERTAVDVVTMSDDFAVTAIVQLEDYGFVEKGEGGPFAESGQIGPGGELPVNPHGGLLGCGHGATNWGNYAECVAQLRHDGGVRQVPDAEIGLAGSSSGIVSTHYVSLLSRG